MVYPVENVKDVNKGGVKSYFMYGCWLVVEWDCDVVDVRDDVTEYVNRPWDSNAAAEECSSFGINSLLLYSTEGTFLTLVRKDDASEEDTLLDLQSFVSVTGIDDGVLYFNTIQSMSGNIDMWKAIGEFAVSTVAGPKGTLIPVVWTDNTQYYDLSGWTADSDADIVKDYEALRKQYPALDEIDKMTEDRYVCVRSTYYLVFNRNHNAYNGSTARSKYMYPIAMHHIAAAVADGVDCVERCADYVSGIADDFKIVEDGSEEVNSDDSEPPMSQNPNVGYVSGQGDDSGRGIRALANKNRQPQ